MATRPDRVAWVDGEMGRWADITVPLMAQSMQRGTLVFDIFDVVGPAGARRGLGAREHVERFMGSAAAMGMELGFSYDELWSAVGQVAEIESDATYVRLCAWWGEETFALVPGTDRATVAVLAFAGSDLGSIATATEPARLTFAPTIKLPPRVLDPTVKVAASYTHGAVAALAAKRAGFDDVVFLDENGLVAESTVMSLVGVAESTLFAPTTDTVLDGITRRIVLDVAADEDLAVDLGPVSIDRLAAADEVFLCSTSRLVWPVASVDELSWPAPGAVSGRLGARLRSILDGDDPLADHWLQALPS